jgi:hypothetical protein
MWGTHTEKKNPRENPHPYELRVAGFVCLAKLAQLVQQIQIRMAAGPGIDYCG